MRCDVAVPLFVTVIGLQAAASASVSGVVVPKLQKTDKIMMIDTLMALALGWSLLAWNCMT